MIIFECVSAFMRYDSVKVSVHNTREKIEGVLATP